MKASDIRRCDTYGGWSRAPPIALGRPEHDEFVATKFHNRTTESNAWSSRSCDMGSPLVTRRPAIRFSTVLRTAGIIRPKRDHNKASKHTPHGERPSAAPLVVSSPTDQPTIHALAVFHPEK